MRWQKLNIVSRRTVLKGIVGSVVVAVIPFNTREVAIPSILEAEIYGHRSGGILFNYDLKTKNSHYQYIVLVAPEDKTKILKKVRSNAFRAFRKMIKENRIKRENIIYPVKTEQNQKILKFKVG